MADLKLEDLVIRSSSHTPFFGIYLATHGIADGLCMCHASVGCKVKTQYHLVDHDGIADAHNRRRYSQFIDEDLIQGSTEQLEDEIRAWQARRNAQVVIIDGSTPVSLQAQSMKPVIKRMEKATGVHVVHVDSRNYEDDLYTGWAQTIGALLRRQQWPEDGAVREDEVSVLGYPYDRYEQDNQANIAELRRLLWGLGLKAQAIGFAGEDYAAFQQVVHARTHILLPYAHSQAKVLRKLKRDRLKTGLPMSLGGTKRWLQQVGDHIGVPQSRIDKLIKHETGRIKQLFELAHRRLRGRRFAVFAEAPRAAGIAATLIEAGMVPVTIGVLHFSLGGRQAVEKILRDHHGVEVPDFVRWLEDPTPHELRALTAHARAAGPRQGQGRDERRDEPREEAPPQTVGYEHADVAIGTTIERELLADGETPWVEMGFPSENHHCLFPSPWLGFNGVLHTLQRVMEALER